MMVHADAPAVTPRRLLVRAVAQIVVSTTALLTMYYFLPLDRALSVSVVAWFTAGLIVFVVLAVLQIRGIVRARYPALRAITGFGVTLPVFLLVFASTYLTIDSADPSAFSERLSHTDALYFAVTVFSTVGFGDITPSSETARIVVTVQMIGGLLVVGLLARVAVEAVQRSRRRLHEPGPESG